jgi:hypothetical protein
MESPECLHSLALSPFLTARISPGCFAFNESQNILRRKLQVLVSFQNLQLVFKGTSAVVVCNPSATGRTIHSAGCFCELFLLVVPICKQMKSRFIIPARVAIWPVNSSIP